QSGPRRPCRPVHIAESVKRSWPADCVFDGSADHAVARSHDDTQHQNADEAAFTRLPDQQYSEHSQNRRKENIAADERHQFVEERIAEGSVDKAERGHVEGLQPIHYGESLAGKRLVKSFKLQLSA